ncbi:MAG: head GIN domain-containing protein [Salinivenus sp.]
MTMRNALRRVGCLLLMGLLVVSWRGAVAQDEPTRETREVAAFTEIGFSVPGTVHLRQGEPQSVEVEGPQEVLDQLEVVVEEQTLHIRSEGSGSWLRWIFGTSDRLETPVDVYVTVPTIEGLSVAGSGDIVGETPLQSSSLTLRNAGAGGFDLDLDTDEVELQGAGAGTTRLRGRTERFSAEVAGAGDVEAAELRTTTADVSVAGAGSLRLHVTDRLSAQVMGAGNVRYHGDPDVERNVMGGGTVEAIE